MCVTLAKVHTSWDAVFLNVLLCCSPYLFFPRWVWRSHTRAHTNTPKDTNSCTQACGLPQAGRRHSKLKDGLCNISLFFIQYKTTHKTVLSTCCFTWCVVVYLSCEWNLVPQALAFKIMYFFLGFNVLAVKRGVNPNYTLSQLTTENVPFLSERPFCFQFSAHNQNVCKVRGEFFFQVFAL